MACRIRFAAIVIALLSWSSPAAANSPKARAWLHRHPPERNSVELGFVAGFLRLNERHSLFEADPDHYLLGYKRLRQPNAALGLRAGFYPLAHFGIEAEAGLTPARLRDEPGAGLVYSARGQLVARLGLWSVTPFVLLGAGALGIRSQPAALGRDVDPALHFGGGVQIAINRWLAVRVDVRDLVSDKQGVESPLAAHNLEALLGLSVTIRPRTGAN